MEELRAKLAALEEKKELLYKESRMCRQKIYAIEEQCEELTNDIWDCHREIEKLSFELSEDEKKRIKRDLDYIGKINSVLDIHESKFGIKLLCFHDIKWSASIDAPDRDTEPLSLHNITIILITNSDNIMRIVRSCFTQTGGECLCNKDDTNEEKMTRLQWFSGSRESSHPGPCLQRFQYHPEILDQLLKEL
jgi:hypothetical protein